MHSAAMHREDCTTSCKNLNMDLVIQPLNSLTIPEIGLPLSSEQRAYNAFQCYQDLGLEGFYCKRIPSLTLTPPISL